MLYYLCHLSNYFSPFNVFQYITFRAGGAIFTSLIISIFFGKYFINKLKLFKINQTIREDGPPTHLVKSGTPTMGGVIILISFLVSTILWARLNNRFIWVLILSSTYLGVLGFVDDYLKIVKKHSSGLSASKKILFLSIMAVIISAYCYLFPSNPKYVTSVNIPYLKGVFLNFGVLYIFFSYFIIIGSSNAVNLTDGLDGLAVGSIIFSGLVYVVFAYVAGNVKFSEYLKVISVSGAGEISIFLTAMIGACLGFLWFNCHPAEIFMGDTGSLFLGGSIGVVSVLIKQEVILIVTGGIFVVEALSVLLQVISFRFRKKRIFKMAPLHHHFELKGLPEDKVVIRFWIVAIILALLSLSSLKIR
ncbi:MAG: phospho-N-acetylmuramoyl-pentapeptide-transferase [Elusimicrobia bacterium]|nr:phospho-N-acetylmuramoyl-pentapeptide-transferase [Elusimicrobiota bacterium]